MSRVKIDPSYFSHDSNAKDDPKCVLLIEQLGLEGYGIFWVLVEILREQPDYKCQLNLIPALARRYGTTAEKMTTVVKSYGLFTIEGDEFFFSESLIRRMIPLDETREKRRNAALTRWEREKKDEKNDTHVMQEQCTCNTHVMQERCKPMQSKSKSKSKNNIKNIDLKETSSKEEEKKNEDTNSVQFCTESVQSDAKSVQNRTETTFETFRKQYPGTKRGFQTEYENFCKKHEDHKEAAHLLLPALERLIAWRDMKKSRGEFIPEYAHLSTWINQRRWETEFEEIAYNPQSNNKKGVQEEYLNLQKLKNESK